MERSTRNESPRYRTLSKIALGVTATLAALLLLLLATPARP
jgi:hypothetical protein